MTAAAPSNNPYDLASKSLRQQQTTQSRWASSSYQQVSNNSPNIMAVKTTVAAQITIGSRVSH
jgi:hypothetical protein